MENYPQYTEIGVSLYSGKPPDQKDFSSGISSFAAVRDYSNPSTHAEPELHLYQSKSDGMVALKNSP